MPSNNNLSHCELPDIGNISFQRFKKFNVIYWTLIIMLIIGFVVIQVVRVDVSVKAAGMLRPVEERTSIRSGVEGTIQKMYYREGDFVPKDSVIIKLHSRVTTPRLLMINHALSQKEEFIHDLRLLVSGVATTSVSGTSTALYSNQLHRYLYQLNDQEASLNKVQRELRTDSALHAQMVISDKEFYNKTVEARKIAVSIEAFKREQLNTWQQELAMLRADVWQLNTEKAELLQQEKDFEIRSPVSGTLQGLNDRYEGGIVSAGEIICELSPEGELVAECLIPASDIGLLRVRQPAIFLVDAFNHNYFGTIPGEVLSIDNDFVLVNQSPMFRARCLLDRKNVSLKNGYLGKLKKGLSLQARFIIARRTISQLLFDKIDDWLNPLTA